MGKYAKWENKAYVSVNGDYGTGVLMFDPIDLDESEWEELGNLHDNDRLNYVEFLLKERQ